jgi:serine phosphatase RsbU (regulator of sigma subunit)
MPRSLAAGDTMLLITDGAVEHAGDGGMFGFERVHAALAEHAERGPAQMIDAVLAQLAAFGSQQDDDVTLLALHYTGDAGVRRAS